MCIRDPPGGRGQVPGGPGRTDRAQSVSPLQLATAGGMITAAGLVLGVAAVRPGAPKLSLVLAQLNHEAPAEAAVFGTQGPTSAPVPWWRALLPAGVMALAQRYLGAASQDLNILGISGAELAGRKAALALGGLLGPPVLFAVLLVAGVDLPAPVSYTHLR